MEETPKQQLKWVRDHFEKDGKPFTGIAVEFYPDGKPSKRWPMKDGKWHGVAEEWWTNGIKKLETTYENGLHHGPNTYWAEDGKLQKKQVWEHEKLISEEKF